MLIDSEIKGSIIKDIKNDLSLGKLTSKYGISKTTIYYHVRKIRGRKLKDITVNRNEELLGEFCGIFAGDGNFTKSKNGRYDIRVYTYSKETKYVKHIVLLLKQIFVGCNPYVYTSDSVTTVRASRRCIYDTLKEHLFWEGVKTYSVCLKYDVKTYSKPFLKGFVRGLVDTDGSVDDYGRVAFTTVSRGLFMNAKDAFTLLGFHPTTWIRKRNLSVVIKKKEISQYLNKVKFKHHYKESKARKFAPMVQLG